MNTRRLLAFRGACLAAPLMILGGCALGPDFVRPTPPEADRYTRAPLPASTAEADGHAQRFDPEGPGIGDWWRLFGSAEIDALVQQSAANNPTVRAAEDTLRGSQDTLRAGYGVFFPSAGLSLDAKRQRSVPFEQGPNTPGSIYNLVTLTGSVGYTLDVFGGKRRAVEALRAQADFQRYTAAAAYMTLSANVVDTCIARAGYAAQIRATEQLVVLEAEQVRLAEVQVQSGTAPYSTVLSLRILLSESRALLAPLRQRMDQADDLLATLEGQVPSRANLPDIDLAGITLPLSLPQVLPSELVRQRPDILEAEAEMHAASAGIGVATAAIFPSFTLDGTFGAASSTFGNLSQAGSRFWSLGPSATVPVFQGGALWYGRKAAIDAYQQSQQTYRQVVLAAFAQVADSLNALQHDAEAVRSDVESRDAADRALGLVQVNYRSGIAAFPDVLVADVQAHEARIAYLQAVVLREQDTVALLVALGGGWRDEADPSQVRSRP